MKALERSSDERAAETMVATPDGQRQDKITVLTNRVDKHGGFHGQEK